MSARKVYKNLACTFLCLFTLFLASIFVSQTYYNRIINEQIQKLSLLKSIDFQSWGLMPAPSSVIHKFQPYSYTTNGTVLHNQSMNYQYTFEYKNYSFSQGNTGNIRYLNTWKRQPVQNLSQSSSNEKIKVFNLDAEKVFNYDYYAPDIRRFGLTNAIIQNTIAQDFVPRFYAQYVFEYIFKDYGMVKARVFVPLKWNDDKAKNVYSHPRYGLDSPAKIQQWIKLSDQIQDEGYFLSQYYKGLREDLGLTQNEIMFLAGERSTLRGLLSALNGVLRYKLNDLSDSLCDGDFCTPQELAIGQLTAQILTNQTIFPSTKINSDLKTLNSSIYGIVEFSQFCQHHPQLNCGRYHDPDFPKDKNISNIANFFSNGFLSNNFTNMEFIFDNFEHPDVIEDDCGIPTQGKAVVEYVKYVYTHSYNLPLKQENPDITSTYGQFLSRQNLDTNLDVQAFKRSFTNYNHLQPILDRFRDFLFTELYSRAFYNFFLNSTTKKYTCEDYYKGDFQQYIDDCKNISMDNVADVRVYLSTFLNVDSERFLNQTIIAPEDRFDFFFNQGRSLFAKHAGQIVADFKKQFGCQYTSCTPQEILYKEWKDGSVMKNLPTNYFPEKPESVLAWDEENVLKHVEPQLYKYFENVSSELDPSQILNSETGVYSLFNLMKLYHDESASTYKGLTNKNLLNYLQSIILKTQFSGISLQLTMQQFFTPRESAIIQQKRHLPVNTGGAPWLDPKISVLKLSNNPTRFNYINSGIYNRQKLRTLSQIQDNEYSSSVYQVFKSDDYEVSVTYTSSNKIKGTNLFGFFSKIQENDNVEGYFDMAYQGQTLNYKGKKVWQNENNEEIQAFEFGFDQDRSLQVNVQELSNRTVVMSKDSFFIVQPNTGLTLQSYIKYTVLSKPFYTQYLSQSSQTYPLYQGEVFFTNDDTSELVTLSKNNDSLNLLFLLGIIFSSICLVAFILFLVMYWRSRRKEKFKDENRSLMSQDPTVSASTQNWNAE